MEIEIIDPFDIIFDKENHIFYYEMQIIPSVNKLIESNRFYKDIPQDILEKKQIEGIYLHQDIKYYLDTKEIWDTTTKKFEDLLNLIKKKSGEIVSYEQITGAKINNVIYAGIHDILLENGIIEIKTSNPSKELNFHYLVQLVAYALASGRFDSINDYYIFYYNKKKDDWTIKSFNKEEVKKAFDCFVNGYIEKYRIQQLINNFYEDAKKYL